MPETPKEQLAPGVIVMPPSVSTMFPLKETGVTWHFACAAPAAPMTAMQAAAAIPLFTTIAHILHVMLQRLLYTKIFNFPVRLHLPTSLERGERP